MKIILIAVAIGILHSCSSTTVHNNAKIEFTRNEINLSEIKYKQENVVCSFQFTNLGKTPLIINDVKTSCGCTVPEWPKAPIRPGEKGLIKIKYDAAYPGVFHKTVEVFYNGSDSPLTLNIKGEVEYPDELEATIK